MNIFVDTTANALVISPVSPARCLPPRMTVGDMQPVTLNFLARNQQPLNTGQPVYNYVDYSSLGVVLSLGLRNVGPTGGTFTLSWGAQTTGPLAFNISSYALSVALNALSSIVANGGVVVSGNIGGPFQITWNLNAVRDLFTAPNNSLSPLSGIAIATDLAGTTTNPAIQSLSLTQDPVSVVDSWTPQTAPAVTVTSLNGTVTQRVSIPSGTYGGSFTLTTNGQTTPAIPFSAQLDLVESAMNSLPGVTGCTVSPGQNFWDITIPAWGHAITGNAAGLICPLNLTGTLDLTSQALADLLYGFETGQIPFYIQQTGGSPEPVTIYKGKITLSVP